MTWPPPWNGTVALLGEPDSWHRLRQYPALIPAATEEMLRYDSPVQLTTRIATEDVKAGGSVIAAGRAVVVSIGYTEPVSPQAWRGTALGSRL